MAVRQHRPSLNTYGLPDARRPLKILVAGCGIGGLTAALALREQGHTVQVFEASKQAQETGAALHLTPNAAGLMKRLGIDLEDIGGVQCAGMQDYGAESGALHFSIDITQSSKMWQHPLYLVHRRRIHSCLKERVLSSEGKGKPVELHLSCPVVSVDAGEALITLEDGRTFRGDVVIGADGVRSRTRASIPGGALEAFSSGKSAFRFMIPTELLAGDPKTAFLVEKPGYQSHWVKNDRRLITYPCDNNELMNCVAIHPSEESTADTRAADAWQQTCTKEQMLNIYKGFNEYVRAILGKVSEANELKVWPVWDMKQMPTFVEKHLALIGDAAHPLMPYQGQGAGLAMEDAISLAALLPLGTTKKDIPERLQIYNQCRHERDHKIQDISRNAGKDADQLAAEGIKLDYRAFQAYMYNHDEWHASTYALQKHFERQHQFRWRSPLGFGPSPGPRQPVNLRSKDQIVQTLQKLNPESYVTHSVRFKTSRTYLEHFLPVNFSFPSAATSVSATLSCTTHHSMAWLGGANCSQVALYLNNIVYSKKDKSQVHGKLALIQFGNLADQVIADREELGLPKVFADINVDEQNDLFRVRLSWRGVQFGELEWSDFADEEKTLTKDVHTNGDHPPKQSFGPPRPPPEQGLFVHRYIPAVEDPGKADVDHALFYPSHASGSDLWPPERQIARQASVKFEEKNWASLPTLHHIAQALAEMPIFRIEQATVTKGLGVDESSSPVRLE